MKRKLILLAVTIVFLAGFGALLHSPPSMIDAITGATPKAKKAAQAAAQLEGSYVLGINMMSDFFRTHIMIWNCVLSRGMMRQYRILSCRI